MNFEASALTRDMPDLGQLGANPPTPRIERARSLHRILQLVAFRRIAKHEWEMLQQEEKPLPSRVRARWRLLAEAVRKGKVTQSPVTKRHSGFSLFNIEKTSEGKSLKTRFLWPHLCEENEFQWIAYSPKEDWCDVIKDPLVLRQKRLDAISTAELFGFDNTGNVCNACFLPLLRNPNSNKVCGLLKKYWHTTV